MVEPVNGAWFCKRVLGAAPTLLAVAALMFALLVAGPNPLQQLRENPNFSAADVARLSAQLGLQRPWPAQFCAWLSGIMHGNLGTSYVTGHPAAQLILARLPLTLALTGGALLIALAVSVPLGVWMAIRAHTAGERAATILGFASMGVPSFFVAMLLQLGAVKLQDVNGGQLLLAVGGPPHCGGLACIAGLVGWWRHMLLPMLTLALVQIAGWSRYLRGEMLGTLASDHVLFARAKGIVGGGIVGRHALRLALVPLAGLVAVDVALLFGGSAIIETVFSLPGVGSLLVTSVSVHDSIVVLDIVTFGTALVLAASVAGDVVCRLLDPRIGDMQS